MPSMQEQSRARREEMVQRRHPLLRSVPVAPLSLFKSASRQVTFEIASPRRSPQARSPPMAEPPISAPAQQPQNSASERPSHSTCQIRDIPAAQASPTSDQTCPDQDEHDLGALLIRRAQHRQQHAWTRKRHVASNRVPSRRNRRSVRMQCIFSGLSFIASLVTFLILNFSLQLPTAVSILLVLLTLLCGILLFHGLFRWWLLGKTTGPFLDSNRRGHTRRHHHHRSGYHRSHRRCGHQGSAGSSYHYADPESPFDILPSDDSVYTPTTPVRVHLFRDEEAFVDEKGTPLDTNFEVNAAGAGPLDSESPLPTPPPPAYGLWRCSVRADPNLLHWQRSPTAVSEQDTCAAESYFARQQDGPLPSELEAVPSSGTHRPPSYGSRHALQADSEEEQVEGTTSEGSARGGFHSIEEEVAIDESDWPLHRVSSAVQEVTRMLLADSIHARET